MQQIRQSGHDGPEYPVTLQNVDFSLSDTPERAPIPVFTQNWHSTNMPQWIPRSGLDFLRGVEQVDIQQTIELHDLLATVESENRFLVKIPGGETLFVAAEESSSTQRLCFGSSRAFSMRIVDAGRQEALTLTRQLACRFGILGLCSLLQHLDVKTSRGIYIGRVKQEWTLVFPQLTVRDELDNIIYRVHGPETWFFCRSLSDVSFKILSPDGEQEKDKTKAIPYLLNADKKTADYAMKGDCNYSFTGKVPWICFYCEKLLNSRHNSMIHDFTPGAVTFH